MSSKAQTMTNDDKRTLTPKLRFPAFRHAPGWNSVLVSEVLTVRDKRCSPTAEVPLFSLTIEDGVTAKSARYDREFLVGNPGKKTYKLVEPNDIVYNPSNLRWGAINYSRLDHAVVVSPIYEVLYVTDPEAIEFDFLARALMRPEQITRFIAKGQGTLVERIAVKIEFFLETPLPIPPSPAEQQKIAACLSSLDELIAAEGRKLETLKAHKKGLMQQLFPRPGETRPRLRFPEFQDAPEWTQHTFGEFVVKSFYGTSKSTSETGQYPVLRMGNMVDGRLEHTNLVYIDLDREQFEGIRLQVGDILLNRTNSRELVGKIAMFDLESECITASYIVAYRLDTERLDPSFCNLMLNTSMYQAKIRLLATPSISQANINPTTFRNGLEIDVPSPAEQQRIAGCLSSLDAVLAGQSQKLAALKTHKQALMQQLFPSPEEAEA